MGREDARGRRWTSAPDMASNICVEMIAQYLAGGERSGFGRRDPFRKFSGGGSVDGLAKLLAVGVTE